MLPLRVIACLTVKNEFIVQSESGITIRELSLKLKFSHGQASAIMLPVLYQAYNAFR